MERVVDARALACPLPALQARAALRAARPGERVIVLPTDPEALVDVAAAGADAGFRARVAADGDGWRITLAADLSSP